MVTTSDRLSEAQFVSENENSPLIRCQISGLIEFQATRRSDGGGVLRCRKFTSTSGSIFSSMIRKIPNSFQVGLSQKPASTVFLADLIVFYA